MSRKRRTAQPGAHRKKKKKRRASKHAKGRRTLVIILLLVVAGFFAYRAINPRAPKGPATTHRATRNRRALKVYIGQGEGLRPPPRSIKKGPLKAELREAFKILLWADSGRVIPRGTRLLGVDVRGRTAYLDISREIRTGHPGGTSAEMQTIYAIVNTIALNFPQIDRVKILIEGRTEDTLAGHIDISAPLVPYRKIISAS